MSSQELNMSSSFLTQTSDFPCSWLNAEPDTSNEYPWYDEKKSFGLDGFSDVIAEIPDWSTPFTQEVPLSRRDSEDLILDDVEASTPPDDNHLHEVYALPMPQMDGRGRRGAISGPIIVNSIDSKEDEEGLESFDFASFLSESESTPKKFEQTLPVRAKVSIPSNDRSDNLPPPERNEKIISPQKYSKVQKERFFMHKCLYCDTDFIRHYNLKSHLLTHSQGLMPASRDIAMDSGKNHQYSFFGKQYRTECSPVLDFLKGTSLLTSTDELKVVTGGTKVKNGCIACKIRRVKCDETLPKCIKCTRSGRTNCTYPSNKRKKRVSQPLREIIAECESESECFLTRKGVARHQPLSLSVEGPRSLYKKASKQPDSPQVLTASIISLSLSQSPAAVLINESPSTLQRGISPSSTDSLDPSDAFETDGFWSEDMSGSEDADRREHGQSLGTLGGISKVDVGTSAERFVSSNLSPAKRAMINALMKEFWFLFGQEWSSTVQNHGNGSSESSTAGSRSSPANSQNTTEKILQGVGRGKRRKTDGDGRDASGDDDDDREPKRPKTTSSLPSEKPKASFACPYRKHNPRTYHTRNRLWRTCALNSFENIARLKGHLYRHHRIFQCPRCKSLFSNKAELDAHFVSIEGCELNTNELQEGINDDTEKRLRSRKKAHREQTENERWVEIYGVLFPGEDVPSCYFEEIENETAGLSSSSEFANYEEYSRTELPRIFRNALEQAVAREAQPLEERLKSQLVEMIKECQDKLFSAYKASQTAASKPSDDPENEDLFAVPSKIKDLCDVADTVSMDTVSDIYTPPKKNMSRNSTRETTFAYHDALTQIASCDTPIQTRKKTDKDSGYEENLSTHQQSSSRNTTMNSTTVHQHLQPINSISKFEESSYSPRSHTPHVTPLVENDSNSYFADDITGYDSNQQFSGDMFGMEAGGFVDGQNLWNWAFDGGEFGDRF